MARLTNEERAKRKETARVMERYNFYKSKNICPVCGRKDAGLGHVYCQDCIKHKAELEEKRDPGHLKRRESQMKQYYERVAAGLCVDCDKPTKNGFKKCEKCLDNARWRTRIWALKKRLAEQQGGKQKK